MIPNRRPLAVVHVTLGLEVGGQEKLLVEFARHADRERIRLHFVSLGGRGILADDLEAEGWPVTALNIPGGLRPDLVLRLARLFRKLRADVVHTHDDRPHIYGSPAARLAGIRRVIHTRHGRGLHLNSRQAILVQLAARCTDRFVCVSEDSARAAVAQGVPARLVSTLWNGIDVERFAYRGPDPDGPAVTVARISPEKDLETLLRAAASLAADLPAFRLEVAGDGPCLPNLRELVEELGLTRRVTFLGRVNDVAGLLARASVFVLPSLTEGVSLTILEAMARGLPVVATRVGGNPEVVVDGETGLLVPAQSPAALAEAMRRVLAEPIFGRALGLAGRKRVEACFNVRSMVQQYEALYQGPKSGTASRPPNRNPELLTPI